MKFKFSVSTGYVGSRREDIVEIDDTDLEGLSKEERAKVIEEHWQEWAWNYLDGGWEEAGDA